ncbi:MAG: hypothetical protein LW688_01455 [Cryomorphaceae bacterium]|nr:hypothetical protein [Cryomorphaceae bacterium]
MIRWLMLGVVFTIVMPDRAFCQSRKKRKPKVSFAKGTFYGSYGYNRAWYGKSTLDLTGSGYQIELKGFRAQDDPFGFDPAQQMNPLQATEGQYSVRAGYYLLNHYSLSIGYDKLKYVMTDNQEAFLGGQINPGIDPVNQWSGNYTNETVVLNSNSFFYSNSGLNNVQIDFSRTDNWLAAGRDQQIVFSTIEGLGIGGLISDNSFLFGGIQQTKLRSFSGVSISGHLGFRLEFFKHVFIQSNVRGGLMSQTSVRTRSTEPNAFANQRFGFLQFDTNVGFLLYIRPTNNCNTCPTWK